MQIVTKIAGGSSYATPAAKNVGLEAGVRSDNGKVVITYPAPDSWPVAG